MKVSVTVTTLSAIFVADPRPPPGPQFSAGHLSRMGEFDFCDRREKRATNERGRSRHGAGLRANPKVDRPNHVRI